MSVVVMQQGFQLLRIINRQSSCGVIVVLGGTDRYIDKQSKQSGQDNTFNLSRVLDNLFVIIYSIAGTSCVENVTARWSDEGSPNVPGL